MSIVTEFECKVITKRGFWTEYTKENIICMYVHIYIRNGSLVFIYRIGQGNLKEINWE